MSKLIYLKANKSLDIDLLANSVAAVVPNLRGEKRSETLFFFWIEGASARGIDVSFESEQLIEFRNTICSNEADYHLTNQLVELAQYLFGGELKNEASELVYLPIYTAEQIVKDMQSDAEMVQAMIAMQNKTLTLYGPQRKIHIGPRCLETLQQGDHLATALNALILKVNYTAPEVTYGNEMETTLDGQQVVLKLVSNQAPCVLDKYDYVLFEDEDVYIVLKPDDLIRILPETWSLLDEYTLYAPVLKDSDFEALKQAARTYNVYSETFGKYEDEE